MARPNRTEELSIQSNGCGSVDTVFIIPPASRAAFDIAITPRIDHDRTKLLGRKTYRSVWTQGKPPAFDFHEGDVFHSRDNAQLVQVDSVSGDDLTIRLFRRSYGPTSWAFKSKTAATQPAFAEFLITGEWPP
jgi:hypothetical protein